MSSSLPRASIIGCCFGGLDAVPTPAKAPVEMTLVDRTNHHLCQPLLDPGQPVSPE